MRSTMALRGRGLRGKRKPVGAASASRSFEATPVNSGSATIEVRVVAYHRRLGFAGSRMRPIET